MKSNTHKTNNRKIVMLTDLNSSVSTMLNNTVNLAKIINAQIEVFHVKKPSDVIEKDNQLLAQRKLNKEQVITNKEIQNIINPIAKTHNVTINYTFTFGNVKGEIGTYIKEQKPDLVVLGKRKAKKFNLTGDNITEFVLKQHEGSIMISANDNALDISKPLTLGLFNSEDATRNIMFAEDLMNHTTTPLKSFKLIKNNTEAQETLKNITDKNVDEYVFEHNDNTVKNMSKYVLKNNVNLLLLDRTSKKSKKKSSLVTTDIAKMVNHLNVSILLSGINQPC